MLWQTILMTTTAYVLGSLCSAIPITRAMGLADPREQGSQNPGATNVLRITGSKTAAGLTLAADAMKGVVAVLMARYVGLDNLGLMIVAAAVVMGHCFPLFYCLRGGKGVATSLGAILILAWPVALLMALTWLLMAKALRLSSIAALTAAVLAPVYTYFLRPEMLWGVVFICVLVIVRHHANIYRLIRGEEI